MKKIFINVRGSFLSLEKLPARPLRVLFSFNNEMENGSGKTKKLGHIKKYQLGRKGANRTFYL